MPAFNLQELLQMKFYDLKGNRFEILEGYPENKEYQSLFIKNSTPYHIRFNSKNVIICQIILLSWGAVIITDYCFKKAMDLCCDVHHPFCEIFATLSGYILFHLASDKIRTAKMGSYNIITAPSVTNRATVPAQHVRTMDAHLDSDYLEELSHSFPQLKKIIDAEKNGGFATLHENAGKITLHAASLSVGFIRKIQEPNLDVATKTKLYEEIIVSLLEPKSILMEDSKFSYDQIQSLEYVIAFIKEYTDKTLTIQDLINSSKDVHELTAGQLRKGIKWVQGKTPKAFAKQCKMFAAQRLFGEQYTERDVATFLGYAHLSHFERDFKKQFGITTKQYKESLTENNC